MPGVRRAFRHLTNTHLAHHGLTAETYKQSFGYNGGRSLMVHEVRRHHAGPSRDEISTA